MPSNELFSFEILVNSRPRPEYDPVEEDFVYPSRGLPESKLDRISYVEAFPGSEYSVRVTYTGTDVLTGHEAFHAALYADGDLVKSKTFFEHFRLSREMKGKRLSGGVEQRYSSFLISFIDLNSQRSTLQITQRRQKA
jgi:hypothetical protein